MNKLAQKALELCWEIEKFPASEHQTATVLKASALHRELSAEPSQAVEYVTLEYVGGQIIRFPVTPERHTGKEGWQPIETAPRGPKSFLVYCSQNKNIYAVTYDEEGYFNHFGSSFHRLSEIPTHWMPLPPAPIAGGK